MDPLKTRLCDTIKSLETDQDLSAYLIKVGEGLKKKDSGDHTVKTLFDCAEEAPLEDPHRLAIRLMAKELKGLSWFRLSSGLHVIAAPSGHGKTLWALQYAKQVAMQGLSCTFLSLEMTHQDLGARILADLSTLPLSSIASGELSEIQKELLSDILSQNTFLKKVYVDKFDSLDWTKIEPRLWESFYKTKPSLVVVDFIQMIYDSNADDSRQSIQYANIARKLKLFADQTKSAVLLLSQMNREAIKEIEKSRWDVEVPMSSSSVKESGGIVEAADSVQLVCIPERFRNCPPSFRGKFQVRVDKNRKFGEVGTIHLNFDVSCGKFLP